jgi:protein-S-isoprenylcysteine O-methyltransferase Ste14
MEVSCPANHSTIGRGFLVRRRVPLLSCAVLALVAIELIWRVPFHWHGPANLSDPFFWIGSVLVIGGVTCRSWAAATLVKSRHLAMDGPYACCRHPLYVGSFLILLGYCTLLGQVLATAMLVGTVLITYPPTILREERHLAELFPAAWPGYARAVPAFIPRRLPQGIGPASWERWLRNREYRAAITNLLGLVALACYQLLER